MEIERAWSACVALLASLAVEVSPLLPACLERGNEAELLEVVLVHAFGRLLRVIVASWVAGPVHLGLHREERLHRGTWVWALFGTAVALMVWILEILGAARAVGGAGAALRGTWWESESSALNVVLLHHFHVVPLHHLEEIWWEVCEVWHALDIGEVPLEAHWVPWIVLVKVLQVAGTAFLLRILRPSVNRSIARARQGVFTSLLLMLLIHHNIVGNIVDVVSTLVRPLASSVLVLWARVASLVHVVRLIVPQQ